MATKIKLGQCPKNFTAPVSFQDAGRLRRRDKRHPKYRTRAQFGAYLDEIFAENGVAKPAASDDSSSLIERAYIAGNEKIVGQIVRCGWMGFGRTIHRRERTGAG